MTNPTSDGGRTLAVVGASGDVGTALTRLAAERGWTVVATARDEARLRTAHGAAETVRLLPGSVADDALAAALAAELGAVDAVVITVNGSFDPRPLVRWQAEELVALIAANVGAHQAAARHLLPLVRPGGTYLGIGGGMADLVVPGFVPMSIAQAAQRMLYRGLAREAGREPSVRILELLVSSMVNGPSTRGSAAPEWIRDDEIAAVVCDLLDGSERGPIITVTSPRSAG